MRDIPAEITERCCPCGAQRDESRKRCRKCSARGRWYRHKAWRTRKNHNRYSTGKK